MQCKQTALLSNKKLNARKQKTSWQEKLKKYIFK